jgi:hypothetical protein
MGICCSRSDFELSVPTPEKIQSSQPTSKPNGTTSTPSSRPGTEISGHERARVRAQSQGAALSQRRHDDGRDYPPLSSGGDIFTLQHPDRQEMPSRQCLSGGTSCMQRTRPVSEHVTALLRAPSHLSRRLNRSAFPAIHSSGHQHVDTQPMSNPSSTTSQIPAGRRGSRSRFPSALQSLLPNGFRYADQP